MRDPEEVEVGSVLPAVADDSALTTAVAACVATDSAPEATCVATETAPEAICVATETMSVRFEGKVSRRTKAGSGGAGRRTRGCHSEHARDVADDRRNESFSIPGYSKRREVSEAN